LELEWFFRGLLPPAPPLLVSLVFVRGLPPPAPPLLGKKTKFKINVKQTSIKRHIFRLSIIIEFDKSTFRY
jgi:hypothetical protein